MAAVTITAPDGTVFTVEGQGWEQRSEFSIHGGYNTPAYAFTEGWEPNAEAFRLGHWRPCHVHAAWDRARTQEWDKPDEHVVSYRPGGSASASAVQLRPLTPKES